MITGVGCSWSDKMTKGWMHLLVWGTLFALGECKGVVGFFCWRSCIWMNKAAHSFCSRVELLIALEKSLLYTEIISLKIYFLPREKFWRINALFFFFFFVQYTGRLLTGRREIPSRTLVPWFHFIFPVHGQKVPLLVLSESQKHFVYPGTDW